MIRLLVKLLTLCAFVVIILIALNKAFYKNYKFNRSITSFNENIKESKEIDALFLGTSHVFNSLNPEIIDSECNINTFNFASNLQSLDLSFYILKTVTKKTKIKSVFVETYGLLMDSLEESAVQKNFNVNALKEFDFDLDNLRTMINFVSPKEIPSTYFNGIKNHSMWNKTLNKEEYITSTFFYKGYISSGRFFSRSNKDFKLEHSLDLDIDSKENKQINNLRQRVNSLVALIDFCQEKDIEITLITLPYFLKKKPFNEKNAAKFLIDSLCKNKRIRHLDIDDKLKELKITSKDFRNRSHLNEYGANKISAYFTNYLEKFGFCSNKEHINEKVKNRITVINNNFEDVFYKESFKNKNITSDHYVNSVFVAEIDENQVSFFIDLNSKIPYEVLKNTSLKLKLTNSKNEITNYNLGLVRLNSKNYNLISSSINIDLKKIQKLELNLKHNKKTIALSKIDI